MVCRGDRQYGGVRGFQHVDVFWPGDYHCGDFYGVAEVYAVRGSDVGIVAGTKVGGWLGGRRVWWGGVC